VLKLTRLVVKMKTQNLQNIVHVKRCNMSAKVTRLLKMREYKNALEALNKRLLQREITQKEYDYEALKLDERFNLLNYGGRRF
jgi:hypothetical protein